MKGKAKLIFSSGVIAIAVTGCQSHQAKIDALQKQYDELAAQFHKECSAEYLKIPPTITSKCTDEDKKVQEAWKSLQTERAKQ